MGEQFASAGTSESSVELAVSAVVALGLLRAAIDAVAALDDAVLGAPAIVEALDVEANRLDAVRCRQVDVFARAGAWAMVGAQNAAAWLTTRCRMERRRARRLVRLGAALRAMDRVAAAFAAGAVGLDQVEVLARARERSAAAAVAFGRDEQVLVGWAVSQKLHRFRALVDEWLLAVDEDAGEDAAARHHDGRRVHLSQSFENQWFLDGVLDPIAGEVVASTLGVIERELFVADRARARVELGREPTADEIVRLTRRGSQRRADALVEMATRARVAPVGGRRPAPLFTVLVGEASFARTCELAWSATATTPGSLARWLTAADIERIVFDGPGRVIDVGEARAFTGALRRAVQVVHRTCAHPYCDRPATECHIDHVVRNRDGGPTTQANGRPLCDFHNQLRERHPETDQVFAAGLDVAVEREAAVDPEAGHEAPGLAPAGAR